MILLPYAVPWVDWCLQELDLGPKTDRTLIFCGVLLLDPRNLDCGRQLDADPKPHLSVRCNARTLTPSLLDDNALQINGEPTLREQRELER
jgi:hypothetical protein